MAEHTNCGKQVQRVGMVSLKIGILYYTEIECRNFLREILFNTFSYTDGPFFYPEPGGNDSQKGALLEVRRWRAKNGFPGFRTPQCCM
ncbi:bacteriocin immunity protein [Pseudomonas leptonychotis]|uniref:bacteriocin immunity protein n=1 Tax=Pseudomonas leptonychotis TaxID=2448482 RepID=UPI0039EEB43D